MRDEVWEHVNSPDHYNSNTIETIDLIRDSMESEEYRGYLKGNVFKYVSRYRYKEKENPQANTWGFHNLYVFIIKT